MGGWWEEVESFPEGKRSLLKLREMGGRGYNRPERTDQREESEQLWLRSMKRSRSREVDSMQETVFGRDRLAARIRYSRGPGKQSNQPLARGT